MELVDLGGLAPLPRVEPCVDTRQTFVLSVNMTAENHQSSVTNEIKTKTQSILKQKQHQQQLVINIRLENT